MLFFHKTVNMGWGDGVFRKVIRWKISQNRLIQVEYPRESLKK